MLRHAKRIVTLEQLKGHWSKRLIFRLV